MGMSVLRAFRRAVVPVTLCLSFLASGCYGRYGRNLAFFGTVVAAAAIVSAVAPPPPRVVVVPAERPGWVWQPGYWTRDGHHWVWIEGDWVPAQPRSRWVPTHWEQQPDGTWVLEQGYWESDY